MKEATMASELLMHLLQPQEVPYTPLILLDHICQYSDLFQFHLRAIGQLFTLWQRRDQLHHDGVDPRVQLSLV